MMKKLFLLAVLFAVFATTSCEDDLPTAIDSATDDSTTWNTCILEFDGEIQGFDGKASRSNSWNDNDTIFIRFDNKGDYVTGVAYYNADISKWEVYYMGSLHDIENVYCNVYYFDGPSNTNVELDKVTFNSYVAAYGDDFATYSKSRDVVTVKATLAPLTGRIRFKGQPGDEIVLMRSIDSYSSFDVSNITFTTENSFTKHIVGNDGYTPYIYGFNTSTQMMIYNDESTFEKTFSSITFMGPRDSGYMNIPTWDNCNGWTASKGFNYSKDGVAVSIPENESNISITLNGVTFKMIAVAGGTFTMGATPEQEPAAYDNEYPTHEVTLSDYFIGETEVTQGLWQAVMGNNNPSYFKGPNLPVENVSWNDCQTFVSKLSDMVGIKFTLPTEAQWEYAARGGSKSIGYKYSGSNTVDDVAWYKDNADKKTHAVGTKAANELGIYDMSGNVWEWCSDWYGSYSREAVTNPTGPITGTLRVDRGGYWGGDATTYCRVSARGKITPTYMYGSIGLRLASPSLAQ